MLKLTTILLSLCCAFPAVAKLPKAIEAKYMRSCKNCHTTNVPKAAQSGDKKAWAAVFKAAGNDMKKMIATVKKGKGGMPAKGLCFDCTDKEYEAIIKFMSGK